MKIFKVTVNGQLFDVIVEELKEEAASGSTVIEPIHQITAGTVFSRANETRPAEAAKVQLASSGNLIIPAPMPGSILEVFVKPGDTVNKDCVLVILEAMKMENEITSPYSGTVSAVMVKKGDTVNSGDSLVVIA